MGLFADTLSDARRPLGIGWVRRSADDSAAVPDEVPDDGMQTVFRFQKGQSPAEMPRGYHEASIQPTAQKTLSAADLWSADTVMETSRASADRVKTGVSVQPQANHERILETVQVDRNVPPTMVAANANSESAIRSAMSGRFDADVFRATHKSNVQASSERHVSETGETFGSRPAGRGASPSELSVTTTPTPEHLGSHHPAPPALQRRHAPDAESRTVLTTAAEPGRTLAPTRDLPISPTTASLDTASMASVARAAGNLLAPPGGTEPRPAATAAVAPRTPANRHMQPATASAPNLVIGRIDVTVVADAAPRPQAAAPRGDNGFLSRNYLKRL